MIARRIWISLLPLVFLPTTAFSSQVIAEFKPAYGGASSLTWDGSSLWAMDNGIGIHRHDPISGQERWGTSIETARFFPSAIASDGHHLWGCSWPGLGIAEIDPVNGEVLSERRLRSPDGMIDGAPSGLVWKDGALWMLMSGPVSICRVEPGTGEISQKMPLAKPYATALAWDGDAFWIASREEQRLFRVDPRTGAILESFPAPGKEVTGLAWDGSYLWVSGPGLYKIDTHAEPYEVMNEVRSFWWGYYNLYRDLEWDHGLVWQNGIGLQLMNFDASGAVVRAIASQGPGAAGIAFDGTNLWSVNRFGYELNRLEPSYGNVLDTFPYEGGEPAGMAFDGLHLWIADAGDTCLHQYSWPDAKLERTIPAPGIEPSGVAWDGTNLWESDRLTGLLSRLDAADGDVEFQFRLPFSFPLGIGVDFDHGTVWALDGGAHRTAELSFPRGPSHILNWQSADVDSTVALTWSLTAASTASSITVERRAATAADYAPLGAALCNGPACGFVDSHPIVGAIAYYRLKVGELDGSSKYIGPLSVAHRFSYGPAGSLARPGELRAGAYPNVLAGGNVRIWAVGLPGQRIRARLFDVRGQLVRAMELAESTQGVYDMTWNGTRADGMSVRPGVYFAAFDAASGARATVRITVVR